ncbi:MAG TPA: hypothetical protein VEC36_12105 [Patescibacteria group bacterium]|nr:hypothetical protein [Patescibacteria group bacterium]
MKKLLLLFCSIIIFAGALGGCSSVRRYDDAVRIRPERQQRYEQKPDNIGLRDGRTLRGTVVEVQIARNAQNPQQIDTTVVFLNAGLEDKGEYYERIPLADIELVGTLFNTPQNEFGNVNIFETYNNTEKIPVLRSVPVRNYVTEDCGCEPLSFNASFAPPSIRCPDRNYSWYFVEARGIYSAYNDRRIGFTEVGREALQGEIATGIRFGGFNEWGVGLAYTSGLYAYNSFESLNGNTVTEANRSTLLLHTRYQMAQSVTDFLGVCLKPFAYGQFGATIDKASVDLMRLNFAPEDCNDCNQLINDLKVNGDLGNYDFSLPLTFGLGAGIDVPVNSWLDASFDLGWRSMGFGDASTVVGFENVPSLRRMNVWRFRMGLTY